MLLDLLVEQHLCDGALEHIRSLAHAQHAAVALTRGVLFHDIPGVATRSPFSLTAAAITVGASRASRAARSNSAMAAFR
jgi:hypothetical protein